jgi:hypothetical protein
LVADEGVQIYGGMGYSGEAPMEAAYRDARISRIYEGTNEINRMLCVGMILKSAMKGGIDIMTPGMKLGAELKAGAYDKMPEDKALFADEKWMVGKMKKAVIMVLGSAAMKYMKKLNDEQEMLMGMADMIMQTYAAESVVLRTEKLVK